MVLDELVAEDTSLPTLVRHGVCLRLVQTGLAVHARNFAATGHRRGLDALVSGMLASLPRDEAMARDLGALLRDQPYLGLAHEDAVLDLVEYAGDQAFLVPVATALLQTLWRNLERSGARSSTDLASLALLFKDDTNPSRRLAAMHQLLSADHGRFIDLVIAQTRQRRDAETATAIGSAAAAQLTPVKALEVLEQLSDLAGPRMLAPFVTLTDRNPDLIRKRYEDVLGENRDPALRAELISALGFSERGGTDAANLAMSLDPDVEVRSRAMFVLTARGTPEQAERVVTAMIDNPEVAGDPIQLGKVAVALQSLVGRCSPGAISRLGQRLLQRRLLPGDRASLVKLLTRAVPGFRAK